MQWKRKYGIHREWYWKQLYNRKQYIWHPLVHRYCTILVISTLGKVSSSCCCIHCWLLLSQYRISFFNADECSKQLWLQECVIDLYLKSCVGSNRILAALWRRFGGPHLEFGLINVCEICIGEKKTVCITYFWSASLYMHNAQCFSEVKLLVSYYDIE